MKRLYILIAAVCLALGVQAQEAEEPISITAPDTVINKTAYSFTEQGITISVSYGSAYPAEHEYNNLDSTYFACLAGGSMTISAEQTIQGIAINGWVKKNFSASCDNGTIDYLSDDAEDTMGEPVLTISDIESQAVTITCENQLRCFSVEVYFFENPGSTQGEIMDTVRFIATIATAQDYSEDTLYSSEGRYSYWLMLAPEAGYPQIWLDMYAAVKGDLSGTYSLYDFNVGEYTYIQLSENELDYEYAYDQEFTIARTENGYHIEGWIIADNDVQYEFVYDGLVSGIAEGLEVLQPSETRPKILRDGQVLIFRDGKWWTVNGTYLK